MGCMTLVRRVARPMLASIFVTGGVNALRNPGSRVNAAEKVTPWLTRIAPQLPSDTETLVRINGGVQLVGGSLLAVGRLPRLSALALAGALVPSTLAGHRFWEEKDPAKRANERTHFTKNIGLMGGLLLAAVDTEGSPGLAWRTRHAGEELQSSGRRFVLRARREAKIAAREAKQEAKLLRAEAKSHLGV